MVLVLEKWNTQHWIIQYVFYGLYQKYCYRFYAQNPDFSAEPNGDAIFFCLGKGSQPLVLPD